MFRLPVLLVLGAGAFSIFVFQQGGYLPGAILASGAISLLVLSVWSIQRRRANAGALPPLSATAKRVIATVSVAMLAGVAYSVYWMFWVPKASTTALNGVYNLRDLCKRAPRYYPDAAAYTGAAPHPIAIFAALDSVGLDEVDVEYGAPAQWRPNDAHAVQLVACLNKAEAGPFITDCKFTEGSVPLYQGRFRGTVVEARTGRELGAVSVDGTTGPKCPGAALTKGDNPRIFSPPDLAQLVSALGDKVDR